jgi:hypothetical protein
MWDKADFGGPSRNDRRKIGANQPETTPAVMPLNSV